MLNDIDGNASSTHLLKAEQFGFSAPPPLTSGNGEGKSLLYEYALLFMDSPPLPLNGAAAPAPSNSTPPAPALSHVSSQQKPSEPNPFSSSSIPQLSWVEQQRMKESKRLSQIYDQRDVIMNQHNEATKQQEEVLRNRRMLNQTSIFTSAVSPSSSVSSAESTHAFPLMPTLSQLTPFNQPTQPTPFNQPPQQTPALQSHASQEEEEYESCESEEERENQKQEDQQFEEAITDLSQSVRESCGQGTEEERKSGEDFVNLVNRYKKLQQNKSKLLQQVADETLDSIVVVEMGCEM